MGLFGREKKPKESDAESSHAEVSGQLLNDEGTVHVVSEDKFQPALEKITGGKTDAGHDLEVLSILVAKPGAPDGNTVQVQINGAKVGYLAPDDAKAYRRVVQKLMKEQTVGVCVARIRGGWRLDSGDEGRYQVVLRLAPPELALNDPSDDACDVFERLLEQQAPPN